MRGVIAAQTGHVSSHEAGAIESSGHKVLTLPQHDGKIEPEELADYLNDPFMGMEIMNIWCSQEWFIFHIPLSMERFIQRELAELADICLEYHIPLYPDGARLGYALAADTDVTLKDVADYCDVFYIGGTKSVHCVERRLFSQKRMFSTFPDPDQATGRSAGKGRLLGIQFDTLFTENLYLELGAACDEMCGKAEGDI